MLATEKVTENPVGQEFYPALVKVILMLATEKVTENPVAQEFIVTSVSQ